MSKQIFLFLVADVLVSHGFYLLNKRHNQLLYLTGNSFFLWFWWILHLLLGQLLLKFWSDYIIFVTYQNYFGKSLISMSKVTSLCLTFNQSLDNTIYLRFSFEYLFENFIIVSLHMCISYIFFILFYFSYSSRQIVYFFLHYLQCLYYSVVFNSIKYQSVHKIYEICTFLVLTLKKENFWKCRCMK